jgi:hypothetical protein
MGRRTQGISEEGWGNGETENPVISSPERKGNGKEIHTNNTRKAVTSVFIGFILSKTIKLVYHMKHL